MKKFFIFAAALAATLTVNAAVYDLTTITEESGWTVTDATKNAGESTESKIVYDIAAGVPGVAVPTQLTSNVQFEISNGNGKAKAFALLLGKGYEASGKNALLTIKGTNVGDAIELVVASKGSTAANFVDPNAVFPKNAVADASNPAKCPVKGAEGADDEGYVWVTLKFTSMGGDVVIKEFDAGYRIKSITVGGGQAQGFEDVENVKVVKTIENGQVVIIKNGVRYNAMGAAL